MTVFSQGAADAAGLLVPLAAVQRVAGGHVVFKIVNEGEFRQVPVRIIAKSKDFAQVSGDLKAGDKLAVGDTFVLKSEVGKEEMGGGHGH